MNPSTKAATRFAQVILEACLSRGRHESAARELEELAGLYQETEILRKVLKNPRITAEQRRGVMGAILERARVCPEVKSLVLLLAEHRQTALLPSLAGAYRKLLDAHLGKMRAEVLSAVLLEPPERYRLKRALEQAMGGKVEVSYQVDPGIIGGVIARIGNLVYDGSIVKQLERLKRQ